MDLWKRTRRSTRSFPFRQWRPLVESQDVTCSVSWILHSPNMVHTVTFTAVDAGSIFLLDNVTTSHRDADVVLGFCDDDAKLRFCGMEYHDRMTAFMELIFKTICKKRKIIASEDGDDMYRRLGLRWLRSLTSSREHDKTSSHAASVAPPNRAHPPRLSPKTSTRWRLAGFCTLPRQTA